MSGLLGPVTANPLMMAQALKAREQPRKQLNGQGLLDTAAIGLSPVPVIGDALGLAADASRFYNEPESRTPLNFGLAALGAIPFIPPLVSMGLGKFAQSQGKTLSAPSMSGPAKNQAGAIVYHGSPHKFDQFDSSKIGTGEGAQAYGHGLYFAENPKVAESYSQIAAPPHAGPYQKAIAEDYFNRAGGDKNKALSMLNDAAKTATNKQPIYDAINNFDSLIGKQFGNLYKVDLPDEAIAKMLDWDKPLSQQAPEVRDALFKFDPMLKYSKDDQANFGMHQWLRSKNGSNAVAGMGVPGIRYLDGGSRGAGEGTRNFVVFPGNEGLLKILQRQ